MGYEIKMIVGKSSPARNEFKLSSERYDDDSGFKPERDESGNILYTGRKGHWFSVFAEIDLCKLGYQDDALNRLISKSHETAKENNPTEFYFFYGSDGNTEIKDDRYGSFFWPVPVREVLHAIREVGSDYRRLKWAEALLASMADDMEEIEVIFYGH